VATRTVAGAPAAWEARTLSAEAATDLSVAVPSINEVENLRNLLPRLKDVLATLRCRYEIIIVDGGSTDGTADIAAAHGAKVVMQGGRGYGDAIREAIRQANGEYILTLDADLSHDPSFIPQMWAERRKAALVIASRYVENGSARMPWTRYILSRLLNTTFAAILSLPFRDLSSGFRLYRANVVKGLELLSVDFDINQEILVKVVAEGWSVLEVPFAYEPRENGSSKARLFKFAKSYLRTLSRMWSFRNSIQAADYDERAASSWLLPQRAWQQARYRIITKLAGGRGRKLDIGCGSSRILQGVEGWVSST
jgi:dolichol-phosphate mannosyltransferase